MSRDIKMALWLGALLLFMFWLSYGHTAPVDISFFDSRTQPGESYLLIDDCFVPIKTEKTKDLCYIQKQIKRECGVFYELEKNCEN